MSQPVLLFHRNFHLREPLVGTKTYPIENLENQVLKKKSRFLKIWSRKKVSVSENLVSRKSLVSVSVKNLVSSFCGLQNSNDQNFTKINAESTTHFSNFFDHQNLADNATTSTEMSTLMIRPMLMHLHQLRAKTIGCVHCLLMC